jgi:ligand-binding SRPBCC domain-containing protein
LPVGCRLPTKVLPMSKVYSFKQVQQIPTNIDTAWQFFSSPANLQKITPPEMNFQIISQHHGDIMHPGQIIEYRVKPMLGISLYWMTEITHVEPKKFFVDEQRYGPYKMWHHQHHFREIDGGVEMTDIIHYKIGYGFIGNIANALFVKFKLRQIFEYRRQYIEKQFGTIT